MNKMDMVVSIRLCGMSKQTTGVAPIPVGECTGESRERVAEYHAGLQVLRMLRNSTA